MTDSLDDFTLGSFSYRGVSHDVYRSGEGPAVIVIAEIPGITPDVADFARKVRGLGCTVILPVLFGDPGREVSGGYVAKSFGKACVSKEFSAFATRKTAPVSDWLRALARYSHSSFGGPGVGVVGMCFTGGFALGMMADESVIAPVLSQPSLPLPPFSKKAKASVQLSADDLTAVKDRVADGICVLGLRFTGDMAVPGRAVRDAAPGARRRLHRRGDRLVGGQPLGHPQAGPLRAHRRPRRRARPPDPRGPRPGPRVLPLPPRRARRRLSRPVAICDS